MQVEVHFPVADDERFSSRILHGASALPSVYSLPCYTSSKASMPGIGLPAIKSKLAPPPVDT